MCGELNGTERCVECPLVLGCGDWASVRVRGEACSAQLPLGALLGVAASFRSDNDDSETKHDSEKGPLFGNQKDDAENRNYSTKSISLKPTIIRKPKQS